MSNNPFKFSMTLDEFKAGLAEVPATQMQYIQLVNRLFKAAVEYAVVNANGSLMSDLYGIVSKGSKKHGQTLVAAVQGLTPIKFSDDKFSFSQDKAVALAKKLGLELVKPGGGKQFEKSDLERLAQAVTASLAHVTWTDFKAKPATASSEKSKEEQVAAFKKAVKKIKEQANELGLSLANEFDIKFVEPTATSAVAETPSILDGIAEDKRGFYLELIQLSEGNPAVFEQLAALCVAEAAALMKKAA